MVNNLQATPKRQSGFARGTRLNLGGSCALSHCHGAFVEPACPGHRHHEPVPQLRLAGVPFVSRSVLIA